MIRIITTLSFLIGIIFCLDAQTIFEEDFESGTLPDNWTIVSNASDGGWIVGAATSLSSQYFEIVPNGSNFVIATNDDKCNCNKSNERLISPRIDLSGQTALVLKFDSYFNDNEYQGSQEDGQVLISTDSVNWEVIEDVHGHGSWDRHAINLTPYAGEDAVYIAFRYDDGADWLYGFAIDNITIEVPPVLDLELTELEKTLFTEVGKPLSIKGTLFNLGVDTVTKVELSYSINGGDKILDTLNSLVIPAFSHSHFHIEKPWIPLDVGVDTIKVTIEKINGLIDENQENNESTFIVQVFEKLEIPNKIDEYIGFLPVIEEIANASDGLNKPTDLDFFPILAKDELWVVNQRTENIGGSTLTISDASTNPSNFLIRVDGNAWHFMSLPTGIAFSPDNYNFATSPGVQDANHNGGTFTGPTLWSSDPLIYAQPSGGNGSHLDMLHGSPFSMGIAHEVDNVFWVYDDWNHDIARYDFAEDHGPGNADHDDGKIRRYRNLGISTDSNIPNHMVLDSSKKWMYFVDNGNSRIMRIDITTGSPSITLPEFNETLAEHSEMTNFVVEEVISSGLVQPCGIELLENRLLVSDYSSGDIIIFDIENEFTEIGRLKTGESGITGIKIGPLGDIWYTNRIKNTLNKILPGDVTSSINHENEEHPTIFPNPSSGEFFVRVPNDFEINSARIEILDVFGKKVFETSIESKTTLINLSNIQPGSYLVVARTSEKKIQTKILIN